MRSRLPGRRCHLLHVYVHLLRYLAHVQGHADARISLPWHETLTKSPPLSAPIPPFFLFSLPLRLHQLGVGCSCRSDSPHVAYLSTADGDVSAGAAEEDTAEEDSVVGAE